MADPEGFDSSAESEELDHSESTDTERIVDALRQAIISGEYAPRERLIESDIGNRYGSSRFTTRVAMQQLAFEGFIDLRRNRGATVRDLTLREAIDITEIRAVLEGLAARRAAQRASSEDTSKLHKIIDLMRAVVAGDELVMYRDLDIQFHGEIHAISGNPALTLLLNRFGGQLVRHRFALSLIPGRRATSLSQHEAIVQAIADGDADRAESEARNHVTSLQISMETVPLPTLPFPGIGRPLK